MSPLAAILRHSGLKPILTGRLPRLLASACLLGALAGPWQALAAPAGAPGGSDPAAGPAAVAHHCPAPEHWSTWKAACVAPTQASPAAREAVNWIIIMSNIMVVIGVIAQAAK